jgi:hypothetical protein
MKRRTEILLWASGGLCLMFLVLGVLALTFPGIIFFDAFAMYPIRAVRTRVAIPTPLGNGGFVTFYRNENNQWQSDNYDWNATYRPPNGVDEKLDSWTSNASEMRAYSSGPVVVILKRLEEVGIRTAAGKWIDLSFRFPGPNETFWKPETFAQFMHMDTNDLNLIQDELEPPVRTSSPGAWIIHYAPDRREFVLSYATAGGGGRVLLQLSEDGEKLKVVTIVKGTFNINDPSESMTPDPEPNATAARETSIR